MKPVTPEGRRFVSQHLVPDCAQEVVRVERSAQAIDRLSLRSKGYLRHKDDCGRAPCICGYNDLFGGRA